MTADRVLEVDPLGLDPQALALRYVQIVPEAKDVGLTTRLESRPELLEIAPFGAVRRHLAPLD